MTEQAVLGRFSSLGAGQVLLGVRVRASPFDVLGSLIVSSGGREAACREGLGLGLGLVGPQAGVNGLDDLLPLIHVTKVLQGPMILHAPRLQCKCKPTGCEGMPSLLSCLFVPQQAPSSKLATPVSLEARALRHLLVGGACFCTQSCAKGSDDGE